MVQRSFLFSIRWIFLTFLGVASLFSFTHLISSSKAGAFYPVAFAAPNTDSTHKSGRGLTFSPIKMMLMPEDQILIKGFRGEVEYVVNESLQDLTMVVEQKTAKANLRFKDEWQFSFKREGAVVQIFIEGPTSKPTWNEILALGEIPYYHLKVVGPSRPLRIHWNDGRIIVTQLKSSLQISSIKAEIQASGIRGDVMISTQEGSVRVRDSQGEVKIDSYLAKVEVENVEGRLELENFTGESKVRQISGQVDLSSYKGNTIVAEAKGRLEFKNGQSALHIEKFEGELRGRSGQGPVYADIRGEADVRLESAEGQVNLKLPGSGAWVNVGTAEGSLAVPNFLKLTRLPSQQIRSGRLRGSNSGSVFVRTTSGDIRVR